MGKTEIKNGGEFIFLLEYFFERIQKVEIIRKGIHLRL